MVLMLLLLLGGAFCLDGNGGRGLGRLVLRWMDWDEDGGVAGLRIACFWRTWMEGSVCSCSVVAHRRRAVTYLSIMIIIYEMKA